MKIIQKYLKKYLRKFSELSENHSSHARLIAFFIGIVIMGSAIWYTYQYFSTASRADNPKVTYNFQTGTCTTQASASTCKIGGKIGDLIKINMYLESEGNNKLSGADLIFKYNLGKAGHLSFVSQTSTTFTTTLVEEDHDGTILHIARVHDRNDAALLGAETFTVTFRIQKEGSSRIALITSASTIVGPQTTEDGVYSLTPQNDIGPQSNIPEDTWKNIFNILVTTGAVNPNTTLTPGETTPAPDSATVNPSNAPTTQNFKDIPVNLRLRFQGINTQPKNSSPIDVRIKLVTGKVARKEYETISFTPQGDGAYVANNTFKSVDINAKHSFLIKGPKHIQKRVCELSPSESIGGTYHCKDSSMVLKEGGNTLDFTGVVLLAGDIPVQDSIIDSQDIAYVRSTIGSSDPEAVTRADLNYDGIVDTQDYALIIKALAFKYDD